MDFGRCPAKTCDKKSALEEAEGAIWAQWANPFSLLFLKRFNEHWNPLPSLFLIEITNEFEAVGGRGQMIVHPNPLMDLWLGFMIHVIKSPPPPLILPQHYCARIYPPPIVTNHLLHPQRDQVAPIHESMLDGMRLICIENWLCSGIEWMRCPLGPCSPQSLLIIDDTPFLTGMQKHWRFNIKYFDQNIGSKNLAKNISSKRSTALIWHTKYRDIFDFSLHLSLP